MNMCDTHCPHSHVFSYLLFPCMLYTFPCFSFPSKKNQRSLIITVSLNLLTLLITDDRVLTHGRTSLDQTDTTRYRTYMADIIHEHETPITYSTRLAHAAYVAVEYTQLTLEK